MGYELKLKIDIDEEIQENIVLFALAEHYDKLVSSIEAATTPDEIKQLTKVMKAMTTVYKHLHPNAWSPDKSN